VSATTPAREVTGPPGGRVLPAAALPAPRGGLVRPRRPAARGLLERSLVLATLALCLLTALVAWSGSASAPGWAAAAGGAVPVPLRAAVASLAALCLPGTPLVLLLRPQSRALGAALATSASLAVTVVLALGTLLAGAWHPLATEAVVLAASAVLAVVAGVRAPAPVPGALRAQLARVRPAVRSALPVPSSPAGRRVRRRLVGWAGTAVAAGLFVVQAAVLDTSAIGDLGLVQAVGWPLLACFALTGVVVAVGLLGRRPDPAVLLPALLVVIVSQTSLLSAATGEVSTPTAWVHRGFADLISATGVLPPPFDARMSWAGFFAATSHVVAVGGLPDATALLAPAPVVLDALVLAPLFVIARAVTGRTASAWLALFLVVLSDWYQQDYFAPQAVAVLWLTTVLAVLLWWWRASAPAPAGGTPVQRLRALARAWTTTPAVPPGTSRAAVWGTEALLWLALLAMVVTHQLTPLVAIGALVVVTALGATRFRSLWLVAGLGFTAWFSFGAEGFWSGHLAALLGDVGQVSAAVEGGVAARVGDVPLHQAGQVVRLATSGALALTALAGWWLRRRRRGALLVGALAALPFGLVAVQSYGGEVVIRCFLLATPLLAPLAAEALVRLVVVLRARATASASRSLGAGRRPRRTPLREPSARARHVERRGTTGGTGRSGATRRRSPVTTGVLVTAVVLSGVAATTTRGLNASFERTSAVELDVSDHLVATAPSGTWVASLGNAPYLMTARTLTGDVEVGLPLDAAGACEQGPAACVLSERPDYLLLTPTQQAQGVYADGRAPGWLDDVERQLLASGQYTAQVDDPDVVLLRRSDLPGGTP
jgi:hypothetical protein